MLAYTKVQVASAVVLSGEVVRTLKGKPCLSGWREIRRPADQPGNVVGNGVEHRARGLAAGNPLRIG